MDVIVNDFRIKKLTIPFLKLTNIYHYKNINSR